MLFINIMYIYLANEKQLIKLIEQKKVNLQNMVFVNFDKNNYLQGKIKKSKNNIKNNFYSSKINESFEI